MLRVKYITLRHLRERQKTLFCHRETKMPKSPSKKSGKASAATEERTMLYASNPFLENKAICLEDVLRLLPSLPPPTATTRSGYPHRYHDYDNLLTRPWQLEARQIVLESCGPEELSGDTLELYEHPLMQDPSKRFDYNVKKPMPGPFRLIVNQNGRFIGIIVHVGSAVDNPEEPANGGGFELVLKYEHHQARQDEATAKTPEVECKKKKGPK